MKSLKLILMILMFAIMSKPIMSFAQDDSKSDNTKQITHQYKLTPDEQATKIANRLEKQLKLTSEQTTKVQKLFADRISYVRDLRSKDLISKSEVKAKRKEFRESMKNILTKKQIKKMKKMIKKRFRKMHKHHFRHKNSF